MTCTVCAEKHLDAFKGKVQNIGGNYSLFCWELDKEIDTTLMSCESTQDIPYSWRVEKQEVIVHKGTNVNVFLHQSHS